MTDCTERRSAEPIDGTERHSAEPAEGLAGERRNGMPEGAEL